MGHVPTQGPASTPCTARGTEAAAASATREGTTSLPGRSLGGTSFHGTGLEEVSRHKDNDAETVPGWRRSVRQDGS